MFQKCRKSGGGFTGIDLRHIFHILRNQDFPARDGARQKCLEQIGDAVGAIWLSVRDLNIERLHVRRGNRSGVSKELSVVGNMIRAIFSVGLGAFLLYSLFAGEGFLVGMIILIGLLIFAK